MADGGLNSTREGDGGLQILKLALSAIVTSDLRLNEPLDTVSSAGFGVDTCLIKGILKCGPVPISRVSVTVKDCSVPIFFAVQLTYLQV